MTSVLLIATLLGSVWLTRQLASLVVFFRKPAPRWGLVAFGGLAVIIGSGVAFDRADQAACDEGLKELEMSVGRPPAQPTNQAHATTDTGSRVVLQEPIEARDTRDLAGPNCGPCGSPRTTTR